MSFSALPFSPNPSLFFSFLAFYSTLFFLLLFFLFLFQQNDSPSPYEILPFFNVHKRFFFLGGGGGGVVLVLFCPLRKIRVTLPG